MDTISHSVEGIERLIVERARDAKVTGAVEAAGVSVTCGPDEAAGLMGGPAKLEVEGDTLRLRGAVAYRIVLPPDLGLTIVDAAGDLRVEQLGGSVELGAVHGDLRLNALAGAVRVGHADGDVRADKVGSLTVQETCSGDLRVRNADTLDVATVAGDVQAQQVNEARLQTVHGDLAAEQIGGTLAVERVAGDARLGEAGDARLGAVDGDLSAEGIAGALAAQRVAGDVRLSRIGEVELGTVDGDLSAESIGGALAVERVAGDVRLSGVAEAATLGRTNGDLRAGGLAGGLAAAGVAGDAVLRGPFTEEQSYTLEARGDVALSLPIDADVHLAVSAAGRIRSGVQLTPAPDGSAAYTATLGRGSSHVTLKSGGDLRVAQAGGRGDAGPQDEEWKEWKERMRQEVKASVQANLGDLNTLGERIRQQVMASLASAGIDAGSGQIRFEYGRGAGRGRGARPATPPAPGVAAGPRPPTPPAPPDRSRGAAGPAPQRGGATGPEQMAILKMLEEGTITAAQAEELLRALGG